MTDLETLETLKMAAEAIKQRNAYWQGCNDGSYEMALDMSGYYDICKKIRVLEGEANFVRGYN